jgi:prevent-host-death family protein
VKRFVNVSKFRAQLSRHLRAVRRGQELVITDRDRPVARVVPYGQDARRTQFEVREPIRDAGELRKLRFPPVPGVKTDIVAVLLGDRAKR